MQVKQSTQPLKNKAFSPFLLKIPILKIGGSNPFGRAMKET